MSETGGVQPHDSVGSDRFDVIDVSSWSAAGEEQLGTKPKQWLRDPAERRWLWKAATWNTSSAGDYLKGDDWAERIVTEVARYMDISVASTELAARDGTVGTVSLSVMERDFERLVHGNELLAEIGVTGASPHDRTGYTLDAVSQALEGVAGSSAGSTAFECLAGYLVLDAVVGNTDRHQENWAVIESTVGERCLAPSFDHASSLGFLLDDVSRSAMLATADRNQTPEAWAGRARCRFEGRPHPVEVAVAAFGLLDSGFVDGLLEQVERLDITTIINRVPSQRMSPPARAFAVRVAEANCERLVSYPSRTMDL